MNKLREKFKTKVSINTIGESERFAIQCEQITDDFTVAFYEWRSTSFMKNIDQYTTKELLQHFKENIYGK